MKQMNMSRKHIIQRPKSSKIIAYIDRDNEEHSRGRRKSERMEREEEAREGGGALKRSNEQ